MFMEKKNEKMKVQEEELTILSCMENIVDLAENSKLNDSFYRKNKKYTDFLSEKCDLTPRQSVLLSLWVENEESHESMTDLLEYLDCRHIHLLRYSNEFDVLVQRQLLKKDDDDDTFGFSVPCKVIQAFQEDKMYVPKPITNLKITELLDKIKKLYEQRVDDDIEYDEMVEQVKNLLEKNTHLSFATKFIGYKLSKLEKVLLMKFVIQYAYYYDDDIQDSELEDIYDSHWILNLVLTNMRDGDSCLIKNGYIEYVNQEGLADRCHFKLGERIKEELLSDVLNLQGIRNPTKGLLIHSNIQKKELFFNDKNSASISELMKLLQPDNYKKVLERLAKQGLRKGFSCLFYGAPGTGKTESVMQIARQTGRNIMLVDIASMKSCWVGESEKIIKKLFDNYKSIVRKSDVAPILLFNEADALFGTRMENTQHAVDKMENTIQNIILQEMEDLEGILIATTNLTKNLDKAFERRFIYKIEFAKPDIKTSKKIWHSMLPELKPDELDIIAKKYLFSGGQIENITRKKAINYILNGDEFTFEKLCSYCDDEQIVNSQMKVGY